jgi:hypothetical protein
MLERDRVVTSYLSRFAPVMNCRITVRATAPSKYRKNHGKQLVETRKYHGITGNSAATIPASPKALGARLPCSPSE